MYFNYSLGIADTNLEDMIKPKDRGEQVVSHVLPHVREPSPNFDAMQKLIQGNSLPKDAKANERR